MSCAVLCCAVLSAFMSQRDGVGWYGLLESLELGGGKAAPCRILTAAPPPSAAGSARPPASACPADIPPPLPLLLRPLQKRYSRGIRQALYKLSKAKDWALRHNIVIASDDSEANGTYSSWLSRSVFCFVLPGELACADCCIFGAYSWVHGACSWLCFDSMGAKACRLLGPVRSEQRNLAFTCAGMQACWCVPLNAGAPPCTRQRALVEALHADGLMHSSAMDAHMQACLPGPCPPAAPAAPAHHTPPPPRRPPFHQRH
jgi:hypothetical protein